MQTINDTLTLIRRQGVLELAMKQPGGIRITEEDHVDLKMRRALPDAVGEVWPTLSLMHMHRSGLFDGR